MDGSISLDGLWYSLDLLAEFVFAEGVDDNGSCLEPLMVSSSQVSQVLEVVPVMLAEEVSTDTSLDLHGILPLVGGTVEAVSPKSIRGGGG